MTDKDLAELRQKLLNSRLKSEKLAKELREFEKWIDVLLAKQKPPPE